MELKSMFNMQELRKKQQTISVAYNRAEKAIAATGIAPDDAAKINAILAAGMKAQLSKLLSEPEQVAAPAGIAGNGQEIASSSEGNKELADAVVKNPDAAEFA